MKALFGYCCGVLAMCCCSFPSFADTELDRYWRKIMHPILAEHCTSCHNVADKKAGLDLDIYYYVPSVINHGDRWRNIVEQVKTGAMPPPGQPRMSQAQIDSVVNLVGRILDNALSDPDPGPSVIRRLSHREYSFTIEDLLGVQFDARNYFPADGSGGEGFDNSSRVLFMTPLLMERYYMAADSIVKTLVNNEVLWQQVVPENYRPSVFRRFWTHLLNIVRPQSSHWNTAISKAQQAIIPIATKAFRGFLSAEDRDDLMQLFSEVYFQELWSEPNGFKQALSIVFKRILVSPMFLYRTEVNLPIHKPHAVSNQELATRLSYLLWSSMPDDSLFEVSYHENLHDEEVLIRETARMMKDPKFKRFSESFAPQWLGVEQAMLDPQVDLTLFPEFSKDIAMAMRQEVIDYFHYIFAEKQNLLELIDSDYSFIDGTLASYYEIPEVEGETFRPVNMSNFGRGGVLGMGAVLTATSLANRTSPVLRGQWVLEQILGTPAPPPPPDVPELDESGGAADELGMRAILEKHREAPACAGCHDKMDPIGFAMENFDAVGKWREYYRGEVAIDVSAEFMGKHLDGPTQLKKILVGEKEKFADNFSRKLLSYALGRGIGFVDSPTIEKMRDVMLENDFNSEQVLYALVNSYPFKHRRSDMTELYLEN